MRRGLLQAAVAFHTFESHADIQTAVNTAIILFLLGIFTFTIAYMALFIATDNIDHSMHKQGEETWPEYLFWVPDKSAEEYKTMAKWEFGIALFGGMASLSTSFSASQSYCSWLPISSWDRDGIAAIMYLCPVILVDTDLKCAIERGR
jgi:hypothetical protein